LEIKKKNGDCSREDEEKNEENNGELLLNTDFKPHNSTPDKSIYSQTIS
jgi:hypothetical protein